MGGARSCVPNLAQRPTGRAADGAHRGRCSWPRASPSPRCVPRQVLDPTSTGRPPEGQLPCLPAGPTSVPTNRGPSGPPIPVQVPGWDWARSWAAGPTPGSAAPRAGGSLPGSGPHLRSGRCRLHPPSCVRLRRDPLGQVQGSGQLDPRAPTLSGTTSHRSTGTSCGDLGPGGVWPLHVATRPWVVPSN